VYVDPNAGTTTSGKVPMLGEAKTGWLRSSVAWRKAQR
jgi:hypothetical protein